jgi:energy-coupling factor transporter ATP-binding protein EcfA2
MRCRSIKIHNFRGARDCEIFMDDYALLVGSNGAGKSTVIDAIRVFYEKDIKFVAKTDRPFGVGEKESWDSWIEMEFELTGEESASLAEDWRREDLRLRVRKFLQTNETTSDGKSRAGVIFVVDQNGDVADSSFYGARNVQTGKLGKVIYIPATSRADDHTKLSGPSVLRELLNEIVSAALAGTSAYEDLKVAISGFTTQVKDHDSRGASLTAVEDRLGAELQDWGVDFELGFSPPAAGDLVKQLLQWNLVDAKSNTPLPPERFGSGFERHFIYSLIRMSADLSHGKSPTRKSTDFSPDLTWLLFEEPEAFLHPPQQYELSRALQSEAISGRWQVLLSSHSSHFVSRNAGDLTSIVRIRREEQECSVHQIRDAEWKELASANTAIQSVAAKFPQLAETMNQADYEPEMDALKFFLWLNPDRASAFFAEHVLIVEGTTEVALINQLIDKNEVDLGRGVHVLDTVGKFNIHRFMNLFGALGICHSVLCDEDSGKGWNKDLNQLIKTSSNPLTHSVEFIPGNLEELLKVPPPGRNDRKPQHMLFCVSTGQFDADGLNKFKDSIEQAAGKTF